jgi:hypothetical protein
LELQEELCGTERQFNRENGEINAVTAAGRPDDSPVAEADDETGR